MKINNDQASSAVGLLIGALIVIHSFVYEIGSMSAPGVGFMPLLAGMGIILFTLIGLGKASVQSLKGIWWDPLWKGMKWERIVIALFALFLYALLLKILGFILTTILFIGFLLRVLEHQRWRVAITWAVLSALSFYVVFEVWLKSQLPAGVLGI